MDVRRTSHQRETLNHCCFKVGLPSATLNKHCSYLVQCGVLYLSNFCKYRPTLAYTRRWFNVVSMLATPGQH